MTSNYPSRMRHYAFALTPALLLAACSGAVDLDATEPGPQITEVEPSAPELPPPTGTSQPPVEATVGTVLKNPRNFEFGPFLPTQLIRPDGIRPVYEPRFVAAADAPLHDDELVIGIALEGEAKAYPITVLRFREMVNDELAGQPILVTW